MNTSDFVQLTEEEIQARCARIGAALEELRNAMNDVPEPEHLKEWPWIDNGDQFVWLWRITPNGEIVRDIYMESSRVTPGTFSNRGGASRLDGFEFLMSGHIRTRMDDYWESRSSASRSGHFEREDLLFVSQEQAFARIQRDKIMAAVALYPACLIAECAELMRRAQCGPHSPSGIRSWIVPPSFYEYSHSGAVVAVPGKKGEV